MKNTITFTLLFFVLYNCQVGFCQNGTLPDCITGQIFDVESDQCVKDCTKDQNSNEVFNSTAPMQCQCIQNFIWDETQTLCVRDCSNVPNSNGHFLSTDVTKCQCDPNWVLDSSLQCTIKNCDNMPFSTGQYNPSDPTQCECLPTFIWQTIFQKCVKDCTTVANSQLRPNLLQGKQDQCICSQGFIWDLQSLCVVDCLITNDTQCQSCSFGCQICSFGGCSKCQYSYSWGWDGISQQNLNGSCQKCLRGCTGVCNFQDISICQSCSDNSYRDTSTQLCVVCPIGCRTCTSATQCQSCDLGYHLVGSSCVQACLSPCATCSPISTTTCLSCINGFYLNGNTCLPNTTCIGTPCTSCLPGSFFNTNRCIACPSNCLACTNSITCLICADGYIIVSNQCIPCPPSCKTCGANNIKGAQPSLCNTCNVGFFAEAAAITKAIGLTCDPCESNCLTCIQSSQKCMSCKNNTKRVLNHRCYNHYNMVFKMKVSHDTNKYTVSSAVQAIVIAVSNFFKKNQNQVIIYSIKNGSLIVEGSIEADDEQAARSMPNQLSQQISSNSNFLPFPILQSSAGPYFDDTPLGSSSNSSGNGNILGLILGFSIALFFLAILIPLLVWFCRRRKNQKGEQIAQQSEKHKQYHDNRYQDNNVQDYSQPAVVKSPRARAL